MRALALASASLLCLAAPTFGADGCAGFEWDMKRELELLQVADAAVDEFGRSAGGPRREVARLHEPDTQAAGDRVDSRAGAHDSGADDEDVELGVFESLDRRGTLDWAEP